MSNEKLNERLKTLKTEDFIWVIYIGIIFEYSIMTGIIQIGVGIITYLSIALIIMRITKNELLMNVIHKYERKENKEYII